MQFDYVLSSLLQQLKLKVNPIEHNTGLIAMEDLVFNFYSVHTQDVLHNITLLEVKAKIRTTEKPVVHEPLAVCVGEDRIDDGELQRGNHYTCVVDGNVKSNLEGRCPRKTWRKATKKKIDHRKVSQMRGTYPLPLR